MLRSVRETPLTTLYGGYDVKNFEEAFAERFGFQHSVAMSSGTASLHAAVAALGIGPGDEVIVPTYSFVASVSVVVQQRARPVFCDLDPGTLGIDVESCRKLISTHTKAVIAVHINGMPLDIVGLAQLCRAHKIALIEACAGAVGATVKGPAVGGFGDVGCFSFNVHKLLRVGEGGMAVCRRADLAEDLRAVRVNGLRRGSGPNDVCMLGYNYTMAQPLAALGCAQLARFDELLARRRRNAEILRSGLSGLPITFLSPPPLGRRAVDYWTTMLLPAELGSFRALFLAAAHAEGIPLGPGYGEPLYRIGYLSVYAEGASFPVTEALLPRIITLDPAPYLTASVMHKIINGIHKLFDHIDVLTADFSQNLGRDV